MREKKGEGRLVVGEEIFVGASHTKQLSELPTRTAA
jgi:hypothetical protein